jgi:hypothetical protein
MKTLKIKPKLTPKMLKSLSALSSDDQDYGILYLFTENNHTSFEECKAFWEEQDLMEYATALRKVMDSISPKLAKFNELSTKLENQ